MENNKNNPKVENILDNFMGTDRLNKVSSEGTEKEICDAQTGECYIIRTKDGIVERLNKKYLTEDGRQLLND